LALHLQDHVSRYAITVERFKALWESEQFFECAATLLECHKSLHRLGFQYALNGTLLTDL